MINKIILFPLTLVFIALATISLLVKHLLKHYRSVEAGVRTFIPRLIKKGKKK